MTEAFQYSGKIQAFIHMRMAKHEDVVKRRNKVYDPARHKRPAPKLPRIFEGQQLEHVIAEVKAELLRWRSSKFEFEASCRHGLRAGLCSSGHSWAHADMEAERIVLEALNRIRAQRPTWEQGQPGYVEAREDCRWCGHPLPDELARSGHRISFCCPEHARLALQHWGFEHRSSSDKTYSRVWDAAMRAAAPSKTCANPECGKSFKATHDRGKYCSLQCAGRHKPHQVECECCGTLFDAQTSDTRFCRPTCRTKFAQIANGTWKPKKLSPVVFDFYLTKPVNASIPRWLTPERFDDLVAA